MHSVTNPESSALREEIRSLGPRHYDTEIAPGVRTGEPVPPQNRDALVPNLDGVKPVTSGVHQPAWLPTSENSLRSILQWCGFPHARVFWHRRRTSWKGRIQIVAAHDEQTFARYDAGYGRPKPLRSRALQRVLGYS